MPRAGLTRDDVLGQTAAPAPKAAPPVDHAAYGPIREEPLSRFAKVAAANLTAAAAILGLKGSTFPARKALALTRKLGSHRLASVFALLAQADLDVRGASAVPDHTTLEVLVARLALALLARRGGVRVRVHVQEVRVDVVDLAAAAVGG